MDAKERRERGKRMFTEVTGLPAYEPRDAYNETTLDELFGDLWTRPGLTRKERRWITLSIAGMAGAQAAIDGHVRGALQSGDMSREEMMEFVLHFAHYAGWPLSTNVYASLMRACAALDEKT